MSNDKTHTTNYFDTLIEIAEDSKVLCGTVPPPKEKKSIAQMQYEIISKNPYKFSSDEVLFRIFAERNDLTEEEMAEAKSVFFSKGQACFRSSPLTKTYGFGVHADHHGKIALFAVESDKYQELLRDPNTKKVKAMRSSKK